MFDRPSHILPVIILSQFAGTSVWFAGNAVIPDLQQDWGLADSATAYITIAVQLGFICGTLIFAILSLADRFSPRLVFLLCSLLGALFNLSPLLISNDLTPLLLLRFATGFMLAGIYPVGMKIAASWYDQGLGRALGYLVGALVLGTAFPHLVRGIGSGIPWQQVLIAVSILAALGGLIMYLLVPDGPHLPKRSPFNPRALLVAFHSHKFRASAFGYFGHMWELYAFWAFIPLWLLAYQQAQSTELNGSLWTFWIIAAGFVGCALGGVISQKICSARVAFIQLMISGLCCLISPWLFHLDPWWLLAILLIWGTTVAGDSPQFSTLNAQNAPREYVGSALTIANSIGFFISIISLQLLNILLVISPIEYLFLWLLPGPVIGLWALRPLLVKTANH